VANPAHQATRTLSDTVLAGNANRLCDGASG
jgi:hypothetical protein